MINQQQKRFWMVMLIGLLVVLIFMYISLTFGIYEMTFNELVRTIFLLHVSEKLDLVVFQLRLPRIILAAFIGVGLGVAGAVLQGISKNGLADPGILGINSGAGASIVLFMFFIQGQIKSTDWTSIMTMPLFGLIGGFSAALIVFFISRQGRRIDSQKLLLTGIAVGSGLGAFTLYLSLKMKSQDFEMATVWLSGSIYSANWYFILSIIPWFLICLPIILSKSYILDLFQLGEESMISIGISVERQTIILLMSSIGLVSACVSVAGSISFVGLMSPHIARLLVGNQHKKVIPLSAVIGMVLVVGADFIGKTIVAPSEIPVGIVIAIIGVPYFVHLLFKNKQ
ncbi:iron ABC transporter permease [Bacillus sp. AFS040349]|uniref:FecCD family ABC transporter permease n=1 Tax=Bacillus sp. AFS040349 TaxID=2033502 RepID=UPI000BFC7B35|nr:iron ABC transporter permease [Bacillus sp. AFS040349]PGT76568.1 iron ABC transporter permease [Bacillus sp. AFS040349]